MKTLTNFNFAEKKVLLRTGLDVPLAGREEVADDFRIKKAAPTIKYLVEKGAKIIIVAHLGRPQRSDPRLSLRIVLPILEKEVGKKISFVSDFLKTDTQKIIDQMKPGDILLLENIRFFKEEMENDKEFAQKLASLADVFVLDDFSSCHRNSASVVGVSQYLESFAGFLLEKEVKVLNRVLMQPWRPLVLIIGGAKIETKIEVLKNMLSIADHILVGGQIANLILQAKFLNISVSNFEDSKIRFDFDFDLTSPKLHLPLDLMVSPDKSGELYRRISAPGSVRRSELIFDIGPETIEIFSQIIKEAKMIIWSGPLGFFENPYFERGTREIAERVARNHTAFKLAGGGDTLLALKKFHVRDRFDFISTGGSAMLYFMAGKELPGLKAVS
jgi:triosephosphate isomerase